MNRPGIYVIGAPLRIAVVFSTPDGTLAHVCYPLTPEEAAGLAEGLRLASVAESARLQFADAEFLASMRISQ